MLLFVSVGSCQLMFDHYDVTQTSTYSLVSYYFYQHNSCTLSHIAVRLFHHSTRHTCLPISCTQSWNTSTRKDNSQFPCQTTWGLYISNRMETELRHRAVSTRQIYGQSNRREVTMSTSTPHFHLLSLILYCNTNKTIYSAILTSSISMTGWFSLRDAEWCSCHWRMGSLGSAADAWSAMVMVAEWKVCPICGERPLRGECPIAVTSEYSTYRRMVYCIGTYGRLEWLLWQARLAAVNRVMGSWATGVSICSLERQADVYKVVMW